MPEERKTYWTKAEVHKLFQVTASPETIVNAEERGDIPKADRISQGKQQVQVRKWKREQLPFIGQKFGFLKQPNQQHVICVYTAKGGVLKTTLSFNLARALALNGIRTLIVGLDSQCSITDLVLGAQEVKSLQEFEPTPGLFHVLKDKTPLEHVIRKTDLPTLDILPETVELIALENHIREQTKREELLKNELLPRLKDYSVVIFDTAPSWSLLIHNALVTAQHVFSPVGCDLGSFQALSTNLTTLTEFQKAMRLEWDTFALIPTLVARTKLSMQIQHAYIQQYADMVTTSSIRRAVKGEESLVLQESVFEYDPASPLTEDYYAAIQELWAQVLESETKNGN